MFWRRRAKVSQIVAEPALGRQVSGSGYLGHFGLTAWWDESFTAEERGFLESYLSPLLRGSASWRTGTPPESKQLAGTQEDSARFLSTLAGFLKRSDRVHLAVRLLDKAMGLITNPVDEHFALMAYVEARHRQRDSDPEALQDVIRACRRAIEIAPQVVTESERQHEEREGRAAELYAGMGERFKRDPYTGVGRSPFFKRLAIVLRKQGLKEEAAEVEALHDRIWLPHTIDFKRAKAEERKLARKRV